MDRCRSHRCRHLRRRYDEVLQPHCTRPELLEGWQGTKLQLLERTRRQIYSQNVTSIRIFSIEIILLGPCYRRANSLRYRPHGECSDAPMLRWTSPFRIRILFSPRLLSFGQLCTCSLTVNGNGSYTKRIASELTLGTRPQLLVGSPTNCSTCS